ncbi:hypothetical protein PENANT_c001G03198 [Penicillium antarcticum]|uniref:Uncharacterized protein n=1 Tax=Penicillium antarcticum TaxID=416450 RepID=A0A1V6QN01_9EURO|nr:hypothetical protein PENANT_c001G03198 [Penicillium antarcticum]
MDNNRLSILRPLLIHPIQSFPYHQFCVPISTPKLIFTAALAITPPQIIQFSLQLEELHRHSTLESVPVDVVIDRLLAYVALRTTESEPTVVRSAQIPVNENWTRSSRHRRIPWAKFNASTLRPEGSTSNYPDILHDREIIQA